MEFRVVYDDGEEFKKDSLEDLIETIIESAKDVEVYNKGLFIVRIEIPY